MRELLVFSAPGLGRLGSALSLEAAAEPCHEAQACLTCEVSRRVRPHCVHATATCTVRSHRLLLGAGTQAAMGLAQETRLLHLEGGEDVLHHAGQVAGQGGFLRVRQAIVAGVLQKAPAAATRASEFVAKLVDPRSQVSADWDLNVCLFLSSRAVRGSKTLPALTEKEIQLRCWAARLATEGIRAVYGVCVACGI